MKGYAGRVKCIYAYFNNDVEGYAVAILQEIGKDKRSKIFAEVKEDEPATEKKKNYLKDLGVEFEDSVTKKEASEKIEQSKNF